MRAFASSSRRLAAARPYTKRNWRRARSTRCRGWWRATTAEPQVVPAALLFHTPVSNNGLLGSYFTNAEWKGAPTFTQVDPEIALYFHNIPLPRPYSVEWKGKVYAPAAGAYQFATES